MSKKKKRFKIRYVVLGILLVLVVAAAAEIGTHWDLIKAAKTGLTTDSETILANQEKKDKEIQESLGIEGLVTEEMIAQAQAEIEQSWADTEAGQSGNGLTPGEPNPSGDGQTGEQGQQSGQSGSAPGTGSGGSSGGSSGSGGSSNGSSGSSGGQTAQDITAKYTAKLFGVRGAFEGRVNGLISSAKAEYAALPKEKQTKSAQSAILSSKMGEAEAIEAECDAKVDAILNDMSAELSAAGQSTEAVGQLRNYYEDAKDNQKAAYLAMARGS